ncbi:MAG: lactonase family protein, partial [Pirellulales bacterium]
MRLHLTLALLLISVTSPLGLAAEQIVYFGTGGGDARGIYSSTLDLETGRLSAPTLAAESQSPGFLAIAPDGKFLYCVSRAVDASGKQYGAVQAYAIGEDGGLQRLNEQSSGGAGPCHLVVDHSGRCVLVANYSDGSVAALPIKPDGSLGEPALVIRHEGSSVNEQRQQRPHAHSINVSPDNAFAFAADLGTDDVFVYKLEPAEASLTAHGSIKLAPGSGPRHFAFHPDGKQAFVINELLSTITAFDYDADNGKLTAGQTIRTLPDDFAEHNTTAEVQVHPSGKFVYGSNRGHDTIAVFSRDAETGRLKFVEHEPIRGNTPRNFGIDPTGTYLLAAGQNSNSVAVFRINQETGELDYAESEIEVPTPICVKFLA